MSYSFEELHNKTVEQLREIAKGIEHEAVQGATQMNKERLLPAICKALGIDAHVHHHVVGIDKTEIKKQIRMAKAERDQAVAAGDHRQLKQTLRKIHHLKRQIRAATV
ncbi:MAG: hypothetical protein JXO72_02490 [Vicinamibacteria bacterium]|nr:hypothetical protein [Vicinamibacteria bacterium]